MTVWKIPAIAFFLIGRIASGNPADPSALSEKATELAKARRFDEAVRAWEQALDADPRFFPALFNLGFHYFSSHQDTKAELLLTRAAKVRPDDFNTHYLLGAALSRLNRSGDALRNWRIAQRLQPGNLRLIQLLIVEYTKGRYFNEAAALARSVLEKNPADSNLHFLAIKALQDAGEQTAAAEIAKQAAQRFPNSPRAAFEHGFYLQKQGEIEKATEYLKKAIELDPAYEEPPFFLADLMMKTGRTEEAVPYLRTSIRIRRDYIPARVLLARALIKLDKRDEALAELHETVKLAPTHPQPHLLLSQIYFRAGDEERARQERQISIELRRKNPELLESVQGRPYVDR
jgi:Flp pilus assembly protein TadD